MKIESRRIESQTATAVTTSMPEEHDARRHELPQRVHGEQRRVEDGDAGAVHRVRGERVVARDAQLADDEQRACR